MKKLRSLIESVQRLLEAVSPEKRAQARFRKAEPGMGSQAISLLKKVKVKRPLHKVMPQKGEFYAGPQADDPKGDVTYSQSKSGAPYMSRCVCFGGKRQRLKAVLVSCRDKTKYNKRYKDKNPRSGTKSVILDRKKKRKKK